MNNQNLKTVENKVVLNRNNNNKVAAYIMLLTAVVSSLACSSTPTKSELAREKAIKNSPQWRNGKFFNNLKRNDSSLFKILGRQLRGSKNTVPGKPLPVVKRSKKDFIVAPQKGLRVSWFGHSSVLIEIDGYRVLTDPVWSNRTSPISFIGPKRFFAPPLPLNELPPLDAVVISHDHFDHLDKNTILALKNRVSLFAVPLGVGAYLEEWGIDPVHIVERDWWGEIKIGALTLTATPARHFSGRSLTSVYQNKTLWCGWAIAGPVHRVYYSGDTAMFPGFTNIGKRLGPFDITLIENGAYNEMWADVHLGPEQAVQAHRMVRGKLMVPVHWATFDLAMHSWIEPAERLIVASSKADVLIAIPRPGESVNPYSPITINRWWPKLPWQQAEEAPVISSGLKKNSVQAKRQDYTNTEKSVSTSN